MESHPHHFDSKEARQGWKEGKDAHFSPLSHFVNPSQNLKPIQHKISLYADNTLLYITDPPSSLLSVHSVIKNYSINWTKSEIPPRGRRDTGAGEQFLSLQENKDRLERWNKLPLCLTGCISTVKMNIFPKINYHSVMIPVTPSLGWFSYLNNKVGKFYWKRKKKTKIQKYRAHAIPDFLSP